MIVLIKMKVQRNNMQTNLAQMKHSKYDRYSLNYSKDQDQNSRTEKAQSEKSKSKKRKPDYSQQRQQKRGE